MEQTATILTTNSATADRIEKAYHKDTTSDGQTFNEWLLRIVLDWVEEVEKPTPTRDLGFGN